VGHDWRDPDVQRAVDWLSSLTPRRQLEARLDAARTRVEGAWAAWARGERGALYDERDAAAWYLLQGISFATDRRWTSPEAVVRVVPTLTRLGQELQLLETIPGAGVRAERLMTSESAQPDAGLYELLVALAYRRHGWTVGFVPEVRGGGRTADLEVARPRSRWAIECKRMARSGYAAAERTVGEKLAEPVHAWCRAQGLSLVVDAFYRIELAQIPQDYLLNVVREIAARGQVGRYHDKTALVRVREVDWALARRVLAADDVFYGSSRMIELVKGQYDHGADHSMAADWIPASGRPAYATEVRQASVVSWRSVSNEAAERKATHFLRHLVKAEGQLPHDRPGCVHVGIESAHDGALEGRRHLHNWLHARDFRPLHSRLRWVYANVFVPEVTTREKETWALTETMIPYRIGRHRTAWPLPGHTVIVPEDEVAAGVHWER
jgi:hypothetical protein